MILKFFVLALSCIFIEQIHHVHCQGPEVILPLPPQIANEKEFVNPIASRTINTLLRHLRIILTNAVSATVVRDIFTSVRVVLTDETGQNNVEHFIDFLVNILMDSNTLVSLKILHQRLVQLAASGRNVPMVLDTASRATRRILDEPELLAAVEGLIEGINILLDEMTEQKLREGIARVIKLQKFASFLKPKVVDKIPSPLQKLRRTQSDSQINYQSLEGDKEMQLQTRGVGYGDEHGWINRKDKIGKKGKKGQGQIEGEDREGM